MTSCVQAGSFSDALSRRENLITAIDARTKLGFIFLALVVNIVSPGIYAPLVLAGLSLLTLIVVRVPLKEMLLRLAMPLVMAGVVLVTQMLLLGQTPLFNLSLFGLQLTGYQEGLARGLLVMSRVLAGVSLVLLLSMTTPADKLLKAAAWFRVPPVFVELSLLVYRYIFVLLEEFQTMKDARRVRLGYRSWRHGMRSSAALGASVILRAYDRAERVFEAMRLRGYTGATTSYRQEFTGRDGLTAVCLGLVLAVIFLVGMIAA